MKRDKINVTLHNQGVCIPYKRDANATNQSAAGISHKSEDIPGALNTVSVLWRDDNSLLAVRIVNHK